LIAFDDFGTIGNSNEYSTKQIQTLSLQPYYVSPLYHLIKLKIAQKLPTAY